MSCRLYAAGSNSHGQLGLRDQEDRHQFTRVELPPELSPSLDVLRSACGANHTLLLSARGDLLASGSNQRGQLGPAERDAAPSLAFAPLKAEQLVQDAGLPSDDTRYTVHDIAACWETSFVVLRPSESASRGAQSDVLLSFGANDWGERGVPSAEGDRPTRVSFANLVGDASNARGRMDEEPIVRIIDLQAGPRHVCALVEIETAPPDEATTPSSQRPPSRRMLLGWGASRQGQLGPSASSSAPSRITARPRPILLPRPYTADDVRQISVGKDHTAILLRGLADDHRSKQAQVVLFGSNKHGQLGPAVATAKNLMTSDERRNLLSAVDLLPPNTTLEGDIGEVGCTWNGTYLLAKPTRPSLPKSSSHRLFSFGSNSHGQLGQLSVTPQSNVATTDTVPSDAIPRSVIFPSQTRLLACGSEHVLALLDSGEVYGWGWNEHGNLGIDLESADASEDARRTSAGPLPDVHKPKLVWSPRQDDLASTRRAVKVWAGNATSWVLEAL